MTDQHGNAAHQSLGTLSRTRCEELLRTSAVGRVGWRSGDGPQVLPVTYAWYAGGVVFRTSPDSVLAELTTRQRVAFEIDEIDRTGRTGWSVQVRGTAERVRSTTEITRLWTFDIVVPWAPGRRTVYIGIEPTSITGRAIEAC